MRACIALICTMIAMVMVSTAAPVSGQAEPPADEIGLTPPRLGFVNGRVSFFRPGEPGWVDALVNTPLAAGDRLETDASGSLELQIGSYSFMRAWGNTAIELVSHEPGRIRFHVLEGRVSYDLQGLEPGQRVEAAAPNASAAFVQPGIYRLEVDPDQTRIIVRNGGRAHVSPEGAPPFSLDEERAAVVESAPNPQVSLHPAPPPDSWDDWNSARSSYLLASESARYVPAEVYGASDLDRHGRWQVESEYGPVWVPNAVPVDWAPYSSGVWAHDPYYGWTWVDTAPWGWAPYHYGRWVHLGGRWGWAPGPRVMRPAYAPALVAFFDAPRAQVGIGAPVVSWVALGWGEPCVPWWGRPGFIRRPWWGGWGGPRVVNNVVVRDTTGVRAVEFHAYRNARVHRAVVAAHTGRFGRSGYAPSTYQRVHETGIRPMHTPPEPRRRPAGLNPAGARPARPSETSTRRPIPDIRSTGPLPQATTPRGWNRAEGAMRPLPPENTDLPKSPPGAIEARGRSNHPPQINRPAGRQPLQPPPEATAPSRRQPPVRLQAPPIAATRNPAAAPAPIRLEQTRRLERKLSPEPAPAARPSLERPGRVRPLQRGAPGQHVSSPPQHREAPAELRRLPAASKNTPPAKRLSGDAPFSRRPRS